MDNTTNREDPSSQFNIAGSLAGSYIPNGCIKHCGPSQEQLVGSDPDSERVGVLDYMYVKPSLRHTTTTACESQFKTSEAANVSNYRDLKKDCFHKDYLSSPISSAQQQQQQQSSKQLEQNIELKTFSIKEQYNNCTDGSSRTGSSREDSFHERSRQFNRSFSASDDDVELLNPMGSEEILREVVVHDDGGRSFHRLTPARNTSSYDYVVDNLERKSHENEASEIDEETTFPRRSIPSCGAVRGVFSIADHSSSSAQDHHHQNVGCVIPVIDQSPPADISISRVACSTYTLSPNDSEVAMETDEPSYQDISKNQSLMPDEISNTTLILSEMSADSRGGSEIVDLDKNHLDPSTRSATSNVLYLNDYSFWNGASRGGQYRDSEMASYLNERAEVTKRLQRRDQKKKRLDGNMSKAEDVAEYKGRLTVEEIVAFINDDDDKKRKGGTASTATSDKKPQQERKKKRKSKRDSTNLLSIRGGSTEADDVSDDDDEALKRETTSSEMTVKSSSEMEMTVKSSSEKNVKPEKRIMKPERVKTPETDNLSCFFGDAASMATVPLITAATAAVKGLNLSTPASQASSTVTSTFTAFSSATSPTSDVSPMMNTTFSTADHDETMSVSPPESVFSNFSEGNPNSSQGQNDFFEGQPIVMETEFKVVGPRKQKLKNPQQRPPPTYDVPRYLKRAALPLPPPKRSNDIGGKGRMIKASQNFKQMPLSVVLQTSASAVNTAGSNMIECNWSPLNFPDLSGASVRRGSLGNSPSDTSKKDLPEVETTSMADELKEGITSYARIAASDQQNKLTFNRRRSLESSQLRSDVTMATIRDSDGDRDGATDIHQEAQSFMQSVKSGDGIMEAAFVSSLGEGYSTPGKSEAKSPDQKLISQADISGIEPRNMGPPVISYYSVASVKAEIRCGVKQSSNSSSSIITPTSSQDLISSNMTLATNPHPKCISNSSSKKLLPILDASRNKQKPSPSKAVVFCDEENDGDLKRERCEVSFLFDPNEFTDQTTIGNPVVTSCSLNAGVVIVSQSSNAGGAQEKGMSTDSATSPIAESEFENRLDTTYCKSMPSVEVSPSNRASACAGAAVSQSSISVLSYNSRPIAPLSGSGFSPGVKTPVVVVSPLQFERETSGSSPVLVQNMTSAADQMDVTVLKDATLLSSRMTRRLDHEVVESEPLSATLLSRDIPAQRNKDVLAVEMLRKRESMSSLSDDQVRSNRPTSPPVRSSCGGKGHAPQQAALNPSDEPVRSGNFNLVTAQLFVYQKYQNVLKNEKDHPGLVQWFKCD